LGAGAASAGGCEACAPKAKALVPILLKLAGGGLGSGGLLIVGSATGVVVLDPRFTPASERRLRVRS
jgi:hypothetical protein